MANPSVSSTDIIESKEFVGLDHVGRREVIWRCHAVPTPELLIPRFFDTLVVRSRQSMATTLLGLLQPGDMSCQNASHQLPTSDDWVYTQHIRML